MRSVLAGGLGFTNAEAIAQLRDLGVPVLVLYAPSVEGVYEDIQLVGDATGTSETSAQPSVATMPSRASTATTMPFAHSRAMSLTNSGSFSAAVPMTTRATPSSNQPSTASGVRMPPPSWT